MKYTLKAILILILGCLTHSCLDLDPKDQIADGNYWNSVTDYKLFANQFIVGLVTFQTAYMMRLILINVLILL